MQLRGGQTVLAATDLAGHLACRHLTSLDRAVAEGRRSAPAWRDPALELLAERGRAHEKAYVEHLRSRGLALEDLDGLDEEQAHARTIQAARSGADVIVQASLRSGRWRGRADLLLKVPEPSLALPWSYEVADAKLASETRGGTILQLCLYADLVGEIQGRPADRMRVIKPGSEFEEEVFRFADFQAYYRRVRASLERTVDASPAETYPEPVPHCDICRWFRECDARRRADDHLSLVANMSRAHADELRRQGMRTRTVFADAAQPLREPPKRGTREAFEHLHGQARVQVRGHREGRPVTELLPCEPGRGFARLPEPSSGDVFFDLEGDPLFDQGGFEYLFGFAWREPSGASAYRGIWALDRREEKAAFEAFVDFVMERWRAHPGLHVYHYAPYEPSALKRLMARHGTREEEVSRLLRGERLVDLYAVVRQGLRASVESYSIKKLEPFFGFCRGVELPEASAALRRVAASFFHRVPPTDADRKVVKSYNRDDCLAASVLRDWLEEQRAGLVARGESIARPELKSGDPGPNVVTQAREVEAAFQALVAGIPEEPESRSEEQYARWRLAHLLDYFGREGRSAWQEFFRIKELEPELLLEERKAVAFLRFEGEVPEEGNGNDAKKRGRKRESIVHRYSFPPQEVSLDPGDTLHEVVGEKIGTVASIDPIRRVLDIDKPDSARDLHPIAVVVEDVVRSTPLPEALLALARAVSDGGVDGRGRFRAGRDLLLRRAPRLFPAAGRGPLRRPGEPTLDAAIRLARALDHGVLAIQGPPGSGKTYTAARMIVALAREGKRIGVTAVSHKVIRKVLVEALEVARKKGFALEAIHKVKKKGADLPPGLEETTDNGDALRALDEGQVVGGTAWLWARSDAVETLDYLFIDEAGQLSLAHALAASSAARNLILLGDPQQLEQPQKAAHPEGAEIAALAHLLGGRATIPDDLGLFLDRTWRLHPKICAFTSELYYDRRLESEKGLDRQEILGNTPFAGNGLSHVPCAHSATRAAHPRRSRPSPASSTRCSAPASAGATERTPSTPSPPSISSSSPPTTPR